MATYKIYDEDNIKAIASAIRSAHVDDDFLSLTETYATSEMAHAITTIGNIRRSYLNMLRAMAFGTTPPSTTIRPAAYSTAGIRSYAFAYNTVFLSADLTGTKVLGSYAFLGCTNLQSVNLSSITTFGIAAFLGCTKLTSINFGACKTIGISAFDGCTALKGTALDGKFRENLNICKGNIGAASTNACSALLFPSTVTSINAYAFLGCTGLEAISFGSAVTLGTGAFSGCTNLRMVIFNQVPTTMPSAAFTGTGIASALAGVANTASKSLRAFMVKSTISSTFLNKFNATFPSTKITYYYY